MNESRMSYCWRSASSELGFGIPVGLKLGEVDRPPLAAVAGMKDPYSRRSPLREPLARGKMIPYWSRRHGSIAPFALRVSFRWDAPPLSWECAHAIGSERSSCSPGGPDARSCHLSCKGFQGAPRALGGGAARASSPGVGVLSRQNTWAAGSPGGSSR